MRSSSCGYDTFVKHLSILCGLHTMRIVIAIPIACIGFAIILPGYKHDILGELFRVIIKGTMRSRGNNDSIVVALYQGARTNVATLQIKCKQEASDSFMQWLIACSVSSAKEEGRETKVVSTIWWTASSSPGAPFELTLHSCT